MEQFDQSRDESESDEEDYIELPAITKKTDPLEMKEVMNGNHRHGNDRSSDPAPQLT